MDTKTYQAKLEFKEDGEKGEFEAVFATLNVVDHDEDVTLPGAFGEQRVVIEPWNHNWESPPVGKGTISERENEAVVNGRFFLSTEAGKEHYVVAKELGADQEFSYTFNIVEAEPGTFEGRDVRFLKKLEVLGVGQVTKGAGIATRLTSLKQRHRGHDGEGEAGTDEAGDQGREDQGREDGKSDGKPRAATAAETGDLLTRINIVEAGMIRQRIENNG